MTLFTSYTIIQYSLKLNHDIMGLAYNIEDASLIQKYCSQFFSFYLHRHYKVTIECVYVTS